MFLTFIQDLLKKQGVNKIILLSHLGYEKEKQIAQNVSGIDIILGGHTHNMLPDAKKGENLVVSPNGEPVLIIQVGRDGKHVAIPNFQFNPYGLATNGSGYYAHGNCVIKIITDRSGRIVDAQVQGNDYGCDLYSRKLK